MCERCNKPIPAIRLEAMPNAVSCVPCASGKPFVTPQSAIECLIEDDRAFAENYAAVLGEAGHREVIALANSLR
jgi:hypothetical protein